MIAYSQQAGFYDTLQFKVMPTDTNYSCYIEVVEPVQPNLWGYYHVTSHYTSYLQSRGQTHTHTHTQTNKKYMYTNDLQHLIGAHLVYKITWGAKMVTLIRSTSCLTIATQLHVTKNLMLNSSQELASYRQSTKFSITLSHQGPAKVKACRAGSHYLQC